MMEAICSSETSTQLYLPPNFRLVSCSAYSSTLKMEAICSSETSVSLNGLQGVISQKIMSTNIGGNKPSRLAWRLWSKLVFGRCSVRYSTGTSTILTHILSHFPHSLETNTGIGP
jgi:hypothetical protein